jgi:pimeloyl-ACP methyl ester carboxylesterase
MTRCESSTRSGSRRRGPFGHSWGGHLALHLAVAHPDRLLGIVCVGTLGASNEVYDDFGANLTRELSLEQLARFQELDERDTAGTATEEESLEALAIIWPYYFADPDSASPLPFERLGHGADTFTSVAEHFERGTLRDGLPHVALPALFVHGVADPLPARAAVDTPPRMPNPTLVRIAGLGHHTRIERPGEVRRAIGSFLETVQSQPRL